MKDLIIVAAQDAILVTSKGRDEDMRRLVARLKATGYEAATQAVRIDRPWGFYQPLQRGEGFQIRQVIVNPGARLPLQRHRRRAEHWIVVNGMALVTRDGERIRLNENEAVCISPGCVHRLENPGNAPLNLIKVQSGDHLSEDGIVRAEACRARL